MVDVKQRQQHERDEAQEMRGANTWGKVIFEDERKSLSELHEICNSIWD